LAHCQKEKLEIMEGSQNRRFYGKLKCLPLWPVRRGGLWAKHMGLQPGAIGNTLGEHIGNMLGTKEK
jgi:hypothetical protein